MGATDIQCDGIHGEKGDRGKRIELANTYFFKGRKSLTKGNKDEALRMFRASVAIHEEVYGTYHKRTARSYFFLAQTLFKHTNDFDRALTAYRRSLRVGLVELSLDGDYNYVEGAKRAIRELLFDKKAFDIKAVENFFSSIVESIRLEKEGLDYTDKNDYECAIEAFEKCLAIEEKAEGTFPLDLGHLHVRIAEVNTKQGEHGMAINDYRSALSIYESSLGREHVDSIFCLRGIESSLHEKNLSDSVIHEYIESISRSLHHCKKGDAFIESNMFREAVDEYEAARLIEEKSFGKYPLTASDIRKKLGLTFRSLKEYDRAILELRTALSINIFECGEDHQSIIVTLQDIRSVMEEKGYDFSSINKYMNTVAFSVKHERYGEHLLLEKKDFSGAIEEFQKSLGLEVSALGRYHLTQGGLFKAIGDAFLQNAIFDFAVVNYRNALVVYEPILGIEHDYAVSVLTLIGNAARGTGLNTDEVDQYRKIVSESIIVEKTAENLVKCGAESDAIAAYRRVARREGSLIGKYHLSTAHLHGKIAEVLKNMGRYDSAIVSYRYILAINLKSLGMDHMNTENAVEDLVDISILKGLENEDAVNYGQKAKISIEHEDNGDEAMRKENFQSAITHYKKALEIEEHFLGDDHLVIEGLLQKIVECHNLSGKTGQAFHFYRKMIRIYMMYASPDYETNSMLRSLEATVQDLGLSEAQKVEYVDIVKESVKCEINGDFAEESNDYVKAIDQYSRCLLMEQSLLGMLHPSIWPIHKKIGSTFVKKGDIDLAIISHSKALAILESYLGMKEKETAETYNELLNATLKKINCISDARQVGSKQSEKITTFSEQSFEKNVIKENKYNDSAPKEDKKGANIYSVFGLLRNDVSGEENNREGEKMEILKGLAQRWHELDESKTIININVRGHIEGKKSISDTSPVLFPSQRENKQGQKYILQQRNKPDDPDMVFPFTKSRGAKNGSTEKPLVDFEGKSSLITPSIENKINDMDTKNRGIGNLIERFSTIQKMNPIKSDEVPQRKSIPTKEEERADELNSLQNSGAKDVKDVKDDNLPEIQEFNGNRNSKHDMENDNHSDSSSTSFSIASYESL